MACLATQAFSVAAWFFPNLYLLLYLLPYSSNVDVSGISGRIAINRGGWSFGPSPVIRFSGSLMGVRGPFLLIFICFSLFLALNLFL